MIVLIDRFIDYTFKLIKVRRFSKLRSKKKKEKKHRSHYMGFFFRLAVRVLLYASSHRIAHTTAFVKPVVQYWLEREIVQLVHHEGSIRQPIAP